MIRPLVAVGILGALTVCGCQAHSKPTSVEAVPLTAKVPEGCPAPETVRATMDLDGRLEMSPYSGLFPTGEPRPTAWRTCHYERVPSGADGVMRVFLYLTNDQGFIDDRRERKACLATTEGCGTGKVRGRGTFTVDGSTWLSDTSLRIGSPTSPIAGELEASTVTAGLSCTVQTLYLVKHSATMDRARAHQDQGVHDLCAHVTSTPS